MSEQKPFSFADGKDPEAFRTIGEVAQVLGVKQHVLRYWEEQFPMLKPLTRAGGRRYYRPADVALIAEIDRLLHHEGFTIRGARQALSGKGGKGSAPQAILSTTEQASGAEFQRPELPLTKQLNEIRSLLQEALEGG